MRYIIRTKWASIRQSSYIRDENEKDLYCVDGRFFSLSQKKYIKTLDGKTLYLIQNKIFKLFTYSAFVIDPNNNEKLATIRRRIFTLDDHYDIIAKGFGNIQIVGNILGYDYHILVDGIEVGHISRKISIRDSYVLDIDHANPEFFLALVIAIDNIAKDKRDDN